MKFFFEKIAPTSDSKSDRKPEATDDEQRNRLIATPNKALCRSLVDHIRAQFGKGRAKAMPDLHIHHPDHAPIVNPAIPVA